MNQVYEPSNSATEPLGNILGDMLRVSHSLVELFEKSTRVLSQTETPGVRCAIRKLPDEILSVIMGHVVSSFDEARDLSHVSRWFRTVIISSPEIWKQIPLSLGLTIDEARTVVQRSQGSHLKAFVDARPTIPNPKRLLEYTALLGEMMVVPSVFYRHKQYNNLHLPVLRKLSLHLDHEDSEDRHVYESWSMPQLRHLVSNFVPLEHLGTNLVSCKFVFGAVLRMSDFLAFLASCPALETLDLTYLDNALIIMTSGAAVNLPNLKSLAVRSTIPKLQHVLCMCNLTACNLAALTIELVKVPTAGYQYERGAYTDVWCCLFGPFSAFIQRHQTIANLSIHLELESSCLENTPRYIISNPDPLLSNLPSSLESLTHRISHCGPSVQWDITRGDYRKVAFMRVRDSEDLTMEQLFALYCTVFPSKADPKTVIVERCPLIPESELRTAFPLSAIHVEP